MNYSVYSEDFLKTYSFIKDIATAGKEKLPTKKAVILGGPPGVGKSTYCAASKELHKHVVISADDFRRFHPQYSQIVENDLDHYADQTQHFANSVVERLIRDLSAEGYSLVIEGTMRNPFIPIETATLLLDRGYSVSCRMIVGNALLAFQNTMKRAYNELELNLAPRYVPIEKFNKIVNSLPQSAKLVQEFAEMNDGVSFSIINNNVGAEIFNSFVTQERVSSLLMLSSWNQEYDRTRVIFEAFKSKCNNMISDRKQELGIEVEDFVRE